MRYLQLFPVGTLKIDRSFIGGVDDDPRRRAIVAAISALGETLDLTVVAEGVETLRQLEEVRRLGCARGQGYYLGRPVEAEVITRLLEA